VAEGREVAVAITFQPGRPARRGRGEAVTELKLYLRGVGSSSRTSCPSWRTAGSGSSTVTPFEIRGDGSARASSTPSWCRPRLGEPLPIEEVGSRLAEDDPGGAGGGGATNDSLNCPGGDGRAQLAGGGCPPDLRLLRLPVGGGPQPALPSGGPPSTRRSPASSSDLFEIRFDPDGPRSREARQAARPRGSGPGSWRPWPPSPSSPTTGPSAASRSSSRAPSGRTTTAAEDGPPPSAPGASPTSPSSSTARPGGDGPEPAALRGLGALLPDGGGAPPGGQGGPGGDPHSDRPDDFRTEVLGLVKTQMVKNAVIVPAGSKGGFVTLRSAPARGHGRRGGSSTRP
jgi:hypothetical protein